MDEQQLAITDPEDETRQDPHADEPSGETPLSAEEEDRLLMERWKDCTGRKRRVDR